MNMSSGDLKTIIGGDSGTLTIELRGDEVWLGLRTGNHPSRKPEVLIKLTQYQKEELLSLLNAGSEDVG